MPKASTSEGETNNGPSAKALGPQQARLSLLILLAAGAFRFGLFHVGLRITNHPPRSRLIESEG